MNLVASRSVALLAVWLTAWVGGSVITMIAGRRPNPGLQVLSGIAYWSAVPFLLPFSGGLVVGLVVAVLTTAVSLRKFPPRFSWRRSLRPAGIFLGIVLAAIAAPQVIQFVPRGMDASMNLTSAHILATNCGLARHYGPFAPEVPFPPVNLGFPVIAAVPSLLGMAPESTTLGTAHMAYAALVLGTYVMLRRHLRPTVASVCACCSFLVARGIPETISWGGYTTIGGFGVAMLAVRLLGDMARYPNIRSAVAAGWVIGALPMIHGVSAGVSLYCVLPTATAVAAWSAAPNSKRFVGLLVVAALFAGVIVGSMAIRTGGLGNKENAEWVRDWQQRNAPKQTNQPVVIVVAKYLEGNAGSPNLIGLFGGLVILLYRRQFGIVTAIGASTFLVGLVVANSLDWFLPASMLLFPERAIFLLAPLSAAAIGFAWRSHRLKPRLARRLGAIAILAILPVAVSRHWEKYQHEGLRPVVSKDEQAAIVWCKRELSAPEHFVRGRYGSASAYLPGAAGIACTGWHVHFTILADADLMNRERRITHEWLSPEQMVPLGAKIVFQSGDVRIVELPQP